MGEDYGGGRGKGWGEKKEREREGGGEIGEISPDRRAGL